MVGRNVSHYEIIGELGRGGMGVVYKARDTTLNRLVALKLLRPELARDPRRVALLRREAQASARLNHPRIVTIYTVEEAEGQLFLTMEYVQGRTLDRAIPADGFELDRFLKIAIPLADALSAAHDEQIVHRDLKPRNILLSKDDRPKILDFGLARLRPDETADSIPRDGEPAHRPLDSRLETLEGRLVGTVPYMSPEQLRGDPVDHRTDFFSLGIIYYQMATGRYPYGPDLGSAMSKILQGSPDSVADVRTDLPRQLGRLVRHCLEKDPEQRIQSAKDLRTGLVDLERELAVSGRRRAAAAPAAEAPRARRPVLLAILAAAAILAGAGGLLYDHFRAPPPPPSPRHLAVQETRVFPGDRGPEYLRLGVINLLRGQLARLRGVQLNGGEGPLPDLVVQVDARQTGEQVHLSARIVDSEGGAELGEDVFQGSTTDLFPLVQRAARSIAHDIGDGLDLAIGYRPAPAPTRDAVAVDLYLQALAATGSGSAPADPARVHDLLDRALERDASFAPAHLLAGQTRLGQFINTRQNLLLTRAESDCRAAREADPELGPAYDCIANVLLQQGRALDAVEAFRRAIELDATHLSPHYGMRDAFLNLGLPETAEQVWKALIRVHPDSWAGYYSLGTYYQNSHRYEEALDQYRQALALAPRHPDLYAYLGTVYFYLGRFEEATVALQDSIALRPSWDAYYDLGGIYYSLRRFGAAVSAFEKAVELADSRYQACHSRGRLGWALFWAPDRRRESRPQLAQAITLSAAQLEAEPGDSDTLILTALYQALAGDREASLRSLARALELRPNDAHYFYIAGLALNHLGDADASLDWLQRAVRGGYSTAEVRTVVDLDNLHHDPRFQQLLREADLSQP